MMLRCCWAIPFLLTELAAAQPSIRPGENGVQPGFVLESWTATDGLPVNSISQVIQSRSGYIWLATFDGLVRFDGVRFTTFNTGNSKGLPSNRIVDVMEGDNGSIITITEQGHRLSFANGTFTILEGPRPGQLHAGPNLRLHATGRDGRRWSAAAGEIRVDGRLAYRKPANAGFGMTVTSIAIDHEGSAWFGTTAAGLHQLKPALFDVYTMLGRGSNNIYSVARSRSGGVWAGSWSEGMSRIHSDGTATLFPHAGGVPPWATSVLEDSRGRVWIAAVPCSLPTVRCKPLAGLPNAQIYATHEDDDGTVWIGTSFGLHRLHDGAWLRLQESDGAPRNNVRAILRTPDGALWMATNGGGISRYHNGSFIHVTTAQGLPSDLVRALHLDADGWLWIGTEGKGIARLDPRDWNTAQSRGRISIVQASDGLFDDGIHAILEDASGRLWMSTNRGIFWVRRDELNAFIDKRIARVRSTGYTERHGLLNREANGGSQPAAARSDDGRLWFATQEGVAVVDPARVESSIVRPNVLVENVIAGDAPIRHEAGVVEVTPDRRDLHFEFTALSFSDPENVRFRYRLSPYDENWVDADTRRSATYTRVPPGNYHFDVAATNGQDVWTTASTPVRIRVVPRFFETRTFILLVALALALLVWAAVRWRLARLRTIAVELQKRVDDRTAELRQREALLANQNAQLETQAGQLQELDRAKTRFFANVSHELRTPLTLTIGPLEDVRAQLAESTVPALASHDAVSRIDMALRNARRLFRLVNQILDVSKLEAGGTHLRARRGDLVAFVRGIASAFEAIAERKQINFQVDAPDEVVVWFDPDALEKLLANLLSNAFKFTPERGGILVAVGQSADRARVQVSDSGPGIPPEHMPHIFDRFYQVDETNTRAQPGTGIGLALARELAELHGGTIDVESGPGGGATFTFSIPLGKAHLADDQVVDAPAMERPTLPDGSMIDIESVPVSRDAAYGNGAGPGQNEDVPMLLVVDDNADLREYVRGRFESRYRIVEASDGADALRRATELIPDLVISDVMMPGMDGHTFCAALRGSPETDFIPVILLTAQAESEQRIAGLGRGADDYIVKPFDMRELEARVDNLISSRRRLRERYSAGGLKVVTSPDPLAPSDREFVERLTTAIESNLSNPDFGVIELASAVFQDRSHLFRRTREVLGETPSDLLRRLRLERAATLLNEDNAMVAEVAYGSGFNSVSHFCRVFRAAYGLTPSAYRESRNAMHT